MSIDVPVSFEGTIVEDPSQKASLLGAWPKTPGVETQWKWEVVNPCRIVSYGHRTNPKAAGAISTSKSQPKGSRTTSQTVLYNGAGEILLSPSIECAIDAKRAFQKGNGVEGREMMSRVLETGCGVMVPGGTPVVILKTELLYRFVKITTGKRAGQTGWVFAFWVR
jgi:hypothetical protein